MKRATIRDVARLANVSLSTVSAVINGKDIVSEDRKRKVDEAIARLNYQPTLYASNLARRHTKVLGLIISDLTNPFFAEIAQEFERHAQKQGYQVSLTATDFSSIQLRACVREMLNMRVAGLAVMTSEFDEDASAILKRSNTPGIFLDVGTPGSHLGNIRVDTKTGMFLAVQHLVELGHKRILFVKNSQTAEAEPSLLSHRYRSQGFMAALRKYRVAGVNAEVVDISGPAANAGLEGIRAALYEHSFTAVVAINDLVALGVYRGLHEAGLRIPADVSVVGCDDTFICEFINPPLTTINIPKAHLGRLAVEMLLQEKLLGRNGGEMLVPTTLVIRDSTSPPAPRR